MKLLKLLMEIFWARRLIIILTTVGCALGGIYVVRTTPPRYEATSRVEMQIVLPDPVTGFYLSSKNLSAYIASQIAMIRDYQVAVRAAQSLGWLDDPDLQSAYAGTQQGGVDFEHWVARQISAQTSARLVDDSNILEIKYRGTSPQVAQAVVENLRSGYIEALLEGKRSSAQERAKGFATLAKKTKEQLAPLEAAKGALERETGIVLQGNNQNLDSNKLRSMATAPQQPMVAPVSGPPPSSGMLMRAEAALATAGATLGANHPALADIRRRRDLLAAQVAQERVVSSRGGMDWARREAETSADRMTGQIDKVMAQRPEMVRLRLMQDEIRMYRETYNRAATQAADLQQIANISDAGVIPIGDADVTRKPTFPNVPLTLGGSLALGLLVGVLLSLLFELLARYVRREADLTGVIPGAVFVTVPRVRRKKRAKGAAA